jgi:hypothetical protein
MKIWQQLEADPAALYDVDKATGCWLWNRGKQKAGYGNFRLPGRHMQAHRWFYLKMVGPIPLGLELDHLCGVRACVNPSHLEPVPHVVNTLRGPHVMSVDVVKALRHEYSQGVSCAQLARKYGRSPAGVWNVVKGGNRRDVAEDGSTVTLVPVSAQMSRVLERRSRGLCRCLHGKLDLNPKTGKLFVLCRGCMETKRRYFHQRTLVSSVPA